MALADSSSATLARAIADNPGEVDTELVFAAGDVITVTATDTGSEGWWEGELNGRVGYFPASFVELVEPELPPVPRLRARVLYDCDTGNAEDLVARAGDVVAYVGLPDSPEWVDAESEDGRRGFLPRLYIEPLAEGSGPVPPPKRAPEAPAPPLPVEVQGADDDLSESDVASEIVPPRLPVPSVAAPIAPVAAAPPAPARPPPPTPPAPRVTPVPIINNPDAAYKIDSFFQWCEEGEDRAPLEAPVSLAVGDVRSKFGGLKKYMSYMLMCRGNTVERRYKHFDWLHQRLKEKFPLLILPSPPEKQFSGRFEQQFLQSRRRQLERYLNYCTRHPVIRTSQPIRFFTEQSADSAADWKAGKRACEKDSKESGEKLAKLVDISAVSSSDWAANAEKIAEFKKFLVKNEKQMQALRDADASVSAKRAALAPELEKEADKWAALQERPCWVADCECCRQLGAAFGQFHDARQAEHDSNAPEAQTSLVADVSREYLQFVQSFYECAKHRDAVEAALASAQERLARATAAAAASSQSSQPPQVPSASPSAAPAAEGSSEDLRAVNELSRRADALHDSAQVSTAVLLAEMGNLHFTRARDMREALLAQAIHERNYYSAMAERWNKVVECVEKIPVRK
eukprot:m51a1_g8628 putative sorting nexin-18-like (629) ;mRNA; f:99001-101689